jgi:anaerobic magnesium-protoporphyrin IX monomethyl ester cyclase
MIMKILLINPYYDQKMYMGKLSKVSFKFPPIGLWSLATYLKKNNFEVNLYDSSVEQKDLFEAIEDFSPEIIGITCLTQLADIVLDLTGKIKNAFKDVLIIVGGVHATVLPESLLDSPHIDIVVRGEGEITLNEICQSLQKGQLDPSKIKGISYKKNGRIIHNENRDAIKDLDNLPMLDYAFVDITKYKISPDLRTNDKLGLLMTSRGCPFNCIFCANKIISQGIYRKRSLSSVFQEIDFLYNNSKINQLFIYDDNFCVDRNHVVEFCKKFIEKGYNKKISWWCEARVDSVDYDLLKLIKKAGCKIISFGIESGSQRLLDFIKKGITIEQIKNAVTWAKKAGLFVRATLILGLPTETEKESQQTIKFAYSLPLDQARFGLAVPYPGTDLYKIATKEGFKPKNWASFSTLSAYTENLPTYVPQGRNPVKLKKLLKKANFYFYLRPRIIINFIKRIKSPKSLFESIKGVYYLTVGTFLKK